MKFIGVALASLGLASAATVTKKVSYNDWKVYRINVGSNAAKVNDVVSKFDLQLWKGKPSSSSVVDVMVPPSQIKDFEASTEDVETRIMHDNLGLSISDEDTFSVYAGDYTPDLGAMRTKTLTGNNSRRCSECNMVQILPCDC
jgi:carboxypeptidase A4